MATAGFSRSADQVINKLKKQKKDYRDQKRDGKSGSGRSTMVNFDIIDSILGHRPASQSTGALNSATYLLESMCSSPSTSTAADTDSCTIQEENELEEAETSTSSTALAQTPRSRSGHDPGNVIVTRTCWNILKLQMNVFCYKLERCIKTS